MAVELYANNASTTVGIGGYTSGSGSLTVVSTGGNFPAVATGVTQMHLLIYRLIGGLITPIVNLVATNTTSGTVWAVTAEGTDASALAGDTVICVLSSAGMNQIRADASQFGTFANLPATTNQTKGNRYKQTDGPYEWIFTGSIWQAFYRGRQVTLPPAIGSLTWVNQGGSTYSTTNGRGIFSAAFNASANYRLLQITPPTAPYTYTFRISVTMPKFTDSYVVSIGFLDSSTNKFKLMDLLLDNTNGAGHGGTQLRSSQWTNATTNSGSVAAVAVPIGYGEYVLRINNDGTNCNYSYSGDDGDSFFTFLSETKGTFTATPDRIVFGAIAAVSANNVVLTISDITQS